jgi:hypothetical protein
VSDDRPPGAPDYVSAAGEQLGPFTIYGPDGIRTGWVISLAGAWVPGVFADRDTALLACGYILGGEQHGYVADAWDYRAREHGRDVVAEDLFWLASESQSGL